MIRVHCDRCHTELYHPGALLFGPPDSRDAVRKRHLCSRCYVTLIDAEGRAQQASGNHNQALISYGKLATLLPHSLQEK